MTCLILTVVAESTVIIGGSRLVGLPGLMLVLLAGASWAFVVFNPQVEPRPALVAIAIGAVLVVAVAVPPHGSRDVWSYVMNARIVSIHHTNPYVHPPSAFPHDPFFGFVGTEWRNTKAVYGPLFTGVTAPLTRLAGGSVVRARLAFQGFAALSVVGALVLIWRETHNARTLAFFGLQPAIVIVIVNGGHNDGLVGLAVLAGVLLAARKRWYSAGFVLALGILCKASGVLGLVGIVAWSWHRDRRGAARLLVVATATTVAGYLPAGLVAVRAVAGIQHGNTRASPWDIVETVAHPPGAVVAVVVLTLVTVAAWRWRTATTPGPTATATIAAYLVGGAFVLPWYPAWALPTASLDRTSLLSLLVAAQATFLVAVYEFEEPAHPFLTGAGAVLRTIVIMAAAFTALAVLIGGVRRPPTIEGQTQLPGFPLRP